jgi:hypothetical protein
MIHHPTAAGVMEAVSSVRGNREAISVHTVASSSAKGWCSSHTSQSGENSAAIARAWRPSEQAEVLLGSEPTLWNSWLDYMALAPDTVIDDLAS